MMDTEYKINKGQISAIHALLNKMGKSGDKEFKADLVRQFTEGRETSTTKLSWKEAKDMIVSLTSGGGTLYKDVSKFPEVRRDLALLIDKHIHFSDIERLAYENNRQLLRKVNLFDVYEGEKIDNDKKSYAVSFILQDEQKTLTDKEIDKFMNKLIEVFERELNAIIRR